MVESTESNSLLFSVEFHIQSCFQQSTSVKNHSGGTGGITQQPCKVKVGLLTKTCRLRLQNQRVMSKGNMRVRLSNLHFLNQEDKCFPLIKTTLFFICLCGMCLFEFSCALRQKCGRLSETARGYCCWNREEDVGEVVVGHLILDFPVVHFSDSGFHSG